MTLASFLPPRLVCSVLAFSLLIPPGVRLSVVSGQQAAEPAQLAPFSLGYVPRDAIAVVASRPAVLMNRPLIAPLRETLDELSKTALGTELQPEDFLQSTMVLLTGERGLSPAFITRFTAPDRLRAAMAEQGGAEATFAGRVYQKQRNGWCWFQPDDSTLVISPDEVTLRRCIAAGKAGADSTLWAAKWRGVATRDAAALVNTSLLRGPVGNELFRGLPAMRTLGSRLPSRVAPLWEQSEYIAAELRVSDALELRVVTKSATADEATQVHGALLTSLATVRNALSAARLSVAKRNDDNAAAMMMPIDLVDEILERAQVVRQGTQTGLVVNVDRETSQRLTKVAAPALVAGRAATLRTKSLQNLKQIALAMHNYHDTFKRFPAATQIGPKDTPRSWRVTLLPWLEQQPLYEEYRQDEPWDSDHNKQVLAKMPDVFRCPLDTLDSTSTSYFTFVSPAEERLNRGPGSPFPGNGGTRFADITDGTSNVILAVETKKPGVPWTKPEDLPFTTDGPLPKLGGWYPGGFNLALCDGSVRFVPDRIDEGLLRLLIMRNDGEPTSLPPP